MAEPKGSFIKIDPEMEEAFAKSQQENGTTVTQWTNAAYRVGYGDGTIAGYLIGIGVSVASVCGGVLLAVGMSKFRHFVAKKKMEKAKG